MLGSINRLNGYAIQATDGEVGKIDEFYFDDAGWRVRYLVADTGNWLTGRRVLLPVATLTALSRESHIATISLTRKQVEDSPDINPEQPITRQQEDELRHYFGWANYWVGDPLFGDPTLSPEPIAASAGMAREESPDPRSDPHVESTRDVTGYHIQAVDGEIGHVEDFIVDDRAWTIRYIVAGTRNVLPGKKVLIAPQWVEKFEWAAAKMHVDLTCFSIRNAPPYDSAASIDREYESRLHDYYGRPKYWR
jgi:hypothetical protein